MEILAISTTTSRHSNEYNGNLKSLFQQIVNDRDNCTIVVNLIGKEYSIPVVNGKIVTKLMEQSIYNLIAVSLGTVAFHTNPS